MNAKVIIDHKFLASGHSYLSNEADISVIEKASRKPTFIFCPEDRMKIVEESKHKEP